jgi:3-methyladenine DNA glycosylase AlkD
MKETKKVQEYVNFIEPLMMDPEREVHQGVGWFLREAWKIQPAPVEEFLLKYKDTAARLIFQYATEKMDSEQKERFRRTKK